MAMPRGRPPTHSDEHVGYVVRPIPPDRVVVLDWLTRASRHFPVHALVELDVTQARSRIAGSDPPVSWTGFVIATLAKAVALHPEVNARRAGHRVLFFDRVDVGATVEQDVDGARRLTAVTVHDADRKSCATITAELRHAKQSRVDEPTHGTLVRTVARLPGPLRRAAFQLAGTRPEVAATYGPAVGVTSIGMFSRGWGWAVPVPPLTLILTVGGVADRPVVREGGVVVAPMMPLTVSFDHGVVDGAPAARFVETLRELTETAAALDDPG